MTFGEKLRSYREHCNMSQEEVASKIKASVFLVQAWEAGTNLPTAWMAEKAATRLGLAPWDLYSDDDLETCPCRQPGACFARRGERCTILRSSYPEGKKCPFQKRYREPFTSDTFDIRQ